VSAGGLAQARADAAADTDAALAGTIVIAEIVELHGRALAFAFVALMEKEAGPIAGETRFVIPF
jgi:hypothetical protein